MAKQSIGVSLPVFDRLDTDPVLSLYRQIYERIRGTILSGSLAPGARLPSSRTLAVDLRVSRNTVELAFTQLEAEGFLVRKVGAGTYVASAIPELERAPRRLGITAVRPAAPSGREPLSLRGRHTVGAAGRAEVWVRATSRALAPRVVEVPNRRLFARGLPNLDAFPLATWRRLLARHARLWERESLFHGNAAGYRPLREALVGYLATARGVRCDWRQIIILSGTQQVLDLAARLLLDPGDAAWMEEPGYLGAWGALQSAGARIISVPVDPDGMNVDTGIRLAPTARLAYVTPSHQYPVGVTLSLGRRLALLEWAARAQAWVIEDDYDSEFRYTGRPLAALQALDVGGRVIYAGTFNKLLFPALRLAYAVVPERLVDGFAAARTLVDGFAPSFMQAVLTEFITAGHLSSHVRRMRALYHERRDLLLDVMARRLGGRIEVKSADTGMHVAGWLRPGSDDREISRRAFDKGLDLPPLSRYYHTRRPRPGLFFNYAGISPGDIRRGIDALATLL
ncbi:MAG TPA: PLP-dependent aminotransferase family protein [Gemmatimonadales bacterium]|nr:PLP-dependent aminotransferase family protein [Gemmatimonadales bacterium]